MFDALPVIIVLVFICAFGCTVWALQLNHRPTDDSGEILYLSPPGRRQPRPELRPPVFFENHLPFIPNPPTTLSELSHVSLPPTLPPSPILFDRDSATVSVIDSPIRSPPFTPVSSRHISDFTISAISTDSDNSHILYLEISNPHIGEIRLEDIPVEQDITEARLEV